MDTAQGCSNPPPNPQPHPAALELRAWFRSQDPSGRDGGIVNRRKIAGSNTWSVHACGRALDWFPRNKGAGDWLMSALVRERPFNVQRVIWMHVTATLRGGVWVFEPYTRQDHRDHLHVEVLP